MLVIYYPPVWYVLAKFEIFPLVLYVFADSERPRRGAVAEIVKIDQE